jgi:multiple sugar transport system substrate-binding protein
MSIRASIVLVSCLLFLTTCNRTSPNNNALQFTPAGPAESVTIVTLAVAESKLRSYQPLVEQFEAQHSHILVRLVAESEIVSSDEPNRIAALSAAADVFAYSPTIHENHQYLLDLRPLLNTDPVFNANDFLPGLLDDGDSLWSLPVAASYPLIFFNKAAFDAAGLSYPEPGWTLDEFLTAAQALTQREGDEVVQWGYVPFQVQPLLAAQLAAPLVVDGELRLTDTDVAEALQWLADLFTLHQVTPWLENYKPVAEQEIIGGADPISLVREGRAAMWSADHTLWRFGFQGENVGLATIPRSQQGYAADAVRYGFALSRGTAQQQAAWTLLIFLSQQPPVDDMSDILVPARRSVAAADSFWERVPAAMGAPLQYAADNNITPRLNPAMVDLLRGTLTTVVTHNQPVTDSLAQAVPAGQLVVAEADMSSILAIPPGIPPSAATEIVTEIVFATGLNVSPAHQGLARAFNQNQPDIRVIVLHVDPGRDFHDEITGADCFATGANRIVSNSLDIPVRPLDPLFELDPALSPDDFQSNAIAGLTREGQLLGLPAWIHIPLIQYNQELIDAAGIPEPPSDWTLNEFLQIVQVLTDPSIEQYGFVDAVQIRTVSYGPAQFGVKLIDNSGDIDAINFAAVAPMLGWYVDMVAHYGVHPVLPGDLKSWEDFPIRIDLVHELIHKQKVAMWQGPATRLMANLKTGFAPMPQGPHGYSFSLLDNLVAYFISTETPHVQACWEWLKFLSTQPTASPYLPAHVDTARSAAFADHVGAELANVYLTAVASGSNEAFLTGQWEAWLNPGLVWLTAAAEIAAKGEVTLVSTLADAEDKFSRYRACVTDRQAFENQAVWRECAVGIDPDLAQRY